MPGNDETPDSKPPLSLDDAERLASQFTALWDEPAADSPPAGSPAKAAPASVAEPSPAAVKPSPTNVAEAPQGVVEAAPESVPEPTPAMVAMARPMGSSPDIDPNSVELPSRRSDYAPPRPLAAPQRTMLGLAPPPVQVAQSATTTPLGLASPKASKPALEVVAEASGIGMPAAAPPPPAAFVAGSVSSPRASEPDFELPVPRKRTARVVAIVMGVAALLVGAAGVRTLFFKSGGASSAPVHATTSHAATSEPRTQPAPAAPIPSAAGPEAHTATPAPSEEAPASPTPTENNMAMGAAPTATETAAATTAPAANAVRLATTQTTPNATQTKAEIAKAKTAQRVEEAKRAQHVAHPVNHPHTGAPSHAPVSPQSQGAGAIVRQSPF